MVILAFTIHAFGGVWEKSVLCFVMSFNLFIKLEIYLPKLNNARLEIRFNEKRVKERRIPGEIGVITTVQNGKSNIIWGNLLFSNFLFSSWKNKSHRNLHDNTKTGGIEKI